MKLSEAFVNVGDRVCHKETAQVGTVTTVKIEHGSLPDYQRAYISFEGDGKLRGLEGATSNLLQFYVDLMPQAGR